jgi:hypothetical protein
VFAQKKIDDRREAAGSRDGGDWLLEMGAGRRQAGRQGRRQAGSSPVAQTRANGRATSNEQGLSSAFPLAQIVVGGIYYINAGTLAPSNA